jgi:uncharacterized membrane protein YccF (DUF307 family)
MVNPSSPVKLSNPGPGCLIRGLYFIFVGSWLGLLWILAAWFFNLIIIGLPLGLKMINMIPQIMTLKPKRVQVVAAVQNGATVLKEVRVRQHPFLGRALYFLLIGCWLSLVWMLLAWIFAFLTLGFGMALAFWMFDRVPAITTLARN